MSGRRDCTGLAGTNHRPAQIYSKSQLVTGALVSSAQPQVPPHTPPSPSIKVATFSIHGNKSQLVTASHCSLSEHPHSLKKIIESFLIA